MRGPSSMNVLNLKWIAQLIQKVIRGSHNLEIGSGDQFTPRKGVHFVVHTQEGYVFHLCTKFEADRSIHSKVIKGSLIFEIGSRDPKQRSF